MRIKLKNIGIVEDADIEINSISVITGVNNSGKSTIGKVLYSLATVQNMASDETIVFNKYRSILNELNGISRWINSSSYREMYTELRELLFQIERRRDKFSAWASNENEDPELETKQSDEMQYLEKKFSEIIEYVDEIAEKDGESKNLSKSINNLKLRQFRSEEDKIIKIFTLEEILSNEFSGHFVSENSSDGNAFIELIEDNGDKVNFFVENRLVNFEKSSFDISREYSEAIYFDDPFLLDDPFSRPMMPNRVNSHLYSYKHRRNALNQLNKASRMTNFFDKSIQNENIQSIFSKVLEGEVKRGSGGYFYYNPNFSSEIGFDSLSAGMKSFSTIQMMMEYGLLNNAEYLILDEPETHLHPEWQVRFAELVVLISLHYPIRILLTSHSPYFIEALDIFSKKYGIRDDVRFYFSSSKSNLEQGKVEDVSDNVEVIFKSMYGPLNFLEELRDDIE
ncbi:AAA family ATPase [Enterococcus casseliflavus]|uniref:AAA family ATPase n=1 Tax=Enterococcus casseliflavus TaxID=37734 RepID=UPI003D6AE357